LVSQYLFNFKGILKTAPLYIIFLFIAVNCTGQTDGENNAQATTRLPDYTYTSTFFKKKYDTSHKFKYGFDTVYVTAYKERLAISLYQSQRSFEMGFRQNVLPDPLGISPLSYVARSSKVTGICVGYDKISFSLGITTPIAESEIVRKGKTKYYDYSLAFTGHAYRLELGFRSYKGFYEQNTPNYDSAFTDTSAYFQRPTMQNVLIKSKFLYFFNNRRFSYSAAYTNTYRQLKTAGSLFAYSDIFYNALFDPNGFLPAQVDSLYGKYRTLAAFETYGMTLGGGYTFNLVMFHSLYINATFGLGCQLYQQNTLSYDGIINESRFKVGLTGADVRGALGYNGKNFFISAILNFDISVYNASKVEVTANFISGCFSYGYRFKFKERNWVKWMKNNRFYRML